MDLSNISNMSLQNNLHLKALSLNESMNTVLLNIKIQILIDTVRLLVGYLRHLP